MDRITFDIGLRQLEEQAQDHQFLQKIKDLGYNIVSSAYLRSALDSLDIPEQKQVERKPDEVLDRMYRELNETYDRRRALSNTLHQVVTDKARADLSSQIQVIQKEIATCLKQIQYYKKHGHEVAVIQDTPKFELPSNDFELAKKLENLRQSISRAKSNIKKLEAEGKDTTRAVKMLAKTEEKYEFYQRAVQAKGLQ